MDIHSEEPPEETSFSFPQSSPSLGSTRGIIRGSRWFLLLSGLAACAVLVSVGLAPPLQPQETTSRSEPPSPDLTRDTDGDGIPDLTERSGWLVGSGNRYITDPLNADTDGDGLTDNDEAGAVVRVEGLADTYVGYSNPTLLDTDGDGLSDAEEADEGTSPGSADSDDDGLDDAQEVNVLGTDPNLSDTDSDGHSDSLEVNNRDAQGLDPLFEDVTVSKWDYAGDFAKGALAGDAWREASVAWLAGNMLSGGSSFIPGVGWIIGGVADLRDTIASAIQADWVSAGFSAFGLIPTIGDAAAIPRKAVAFVSRHPELAASAGALIIAFKALPDSIKLDASRQIWKEWGVLRKAGADEMSLLDLQKSGRMNLDSLGKVLGRKGHVSGPASAYLTDGAAGEAQLEDMLRKEGKAVLTQVTEPTGQCVQVCNMIARRFDVVADGVAHESKVGYKTLTPSTRAQINSDAYLVKTGKIKAAIWHFYPSSQTCQIGASAPLLDLLEELDIPYTIHLPAGGRCRK